MAPLLSDGVQNCVDLGIFKRILCVKCAAKFMILEIDYMPWYDKGGIFEMANY